MGVYIKNMEMPKTCDDCFLPLRYCPYAMKPNGECPLVFVPPHGRMIDADAFAAEMKKRQEEAGKWLREAKDHETAVRADAVLSFLCEVKLTLDAVPTVLEAEESE